MSNVYVIVGHRSRPMLEDLFRFVWRPNHHYIIHIDRKAPLATRRFATETAQSFPNVRALPQRFCSWGGWSLTEVMLDAMKLALASWPDWSHFIPLTEHHVPLCDPDTAATRLEHNVSYCAASRVVDLYPEGREDSLHRLEWVWPELPGVGHFATAQRALSQDLAERLYHGSACLILARQACQYVLSALSVDWLRTMFSTSVMSDETAVQTALLGFNYSEQPLICEQNLTLVADPAISGSTDLTFNEDNFHHALSQGLCFIRKRPADLSLMMSSVLEGLAGLTRAELAQRIAPFHVQPAEPADIDPVPIAQAITAELSNLWPAAIVTHVDAARLPNVPALELSIASETFPSDIAVYLASADLRTYKAILMLWRPFDGAFDAQVIDGQFCHLIRARTYDLFFNREVICTFDARSGFGSFDGDGGPPAAARHLTQYLDHAVRIASRRRSRRLF